MTPLVDPCGPRVRNHRRRRLPHDCIFAANRTTPLAKSRHGCLWNTKKKEKKTCESRIKTRRRTTFFRLHDSQACWTCRRFTGKPPRAGSDATNFTLRAGADMATTLLACVIRPLQPPSFSCSCRMRWGLVLRCCK